MMKFLSKSPTVNKIELEKKLSNFLSDSFGIDTNEIINDTFSQCTFWSYDTFSTALEYHMKLHRYKLRINIDDIDKFHNIQSDYINKIYNTHLIKNKAFDFLLVKRKVFFDADIIKFDNLLFSDFVKICPFYIDIFFEENINGFSIITSELIYSSINIPLNTVYYFYSCGQTLENISKDTRILDSYFDDQGEIDCYSFDYKNYIEIIKKSWTYSIDFDSDPKPYLNITEAHFI